MTAPDPILEEARAWLEQRARQGYAKTRHFLVSWELVDKLERLARRWDEVERGIEQARAGGPIPDLGKSLTEADVVKWATSVACVFEAIERATAIEKEAS